MSPFLLYHTVISPVYTHIFQKMPLVFVQLKQSKKEKQRSETFVGALFDYIYCLLNNEEEFNKEECGDEVSEHRNFLCLACEELFHLDSPV